MAKNDTVTVKNTGIPGMKRGGGNEGAPKKGAANARYGPHIKVSPAPFPKMQTVVTSKRKSSTAAGGESGGF